MSSGVIQSHPGPGHPGSQGRWLIIRICVIWLDLPLLVLNCTHSVIWTFSVTLKTTFWPTFTSVTLRQEHGLFTFNVDERFFTSLHNYMLPIAGYEFSHINHVKTPVNGDRLSNTPLKIAFSTSNFSDNMLLPSAIMLFCLPKHPLEQLLLPWSPPEKLYYRLVPAWRRKARAGNDRTSLFWHQLTLQSRSR